MKKGLMLLLAMIIVFATPACLASDDVLPCTWSLDGNRITLSITLDDSQDWIVSFDEPDMLAIVNAADAEIASEFWQVTLQSVPDAAGLVTVTLVRHSETSDEPTSTITLEIYIDADGIPTVLSVNDVTVSELVEE